MKIVYAEIESFINKATKIGAEEIFFNPQSATTKEGEINGFIMSFMFNKGQDMYLCQIIEPYNSSGKPPEKLEQDFKDFEAKHTTNTRAISGKIPLYRGTIIYDGKE